MRSATELIGKAGLTTRMNGRGATIAIVSVGLEGAYRPGWRAQPSRDRRRRVRHRHAHGAEQCDELASPLGSRLPTSAPRYMVEQEDGRCAHHSQNDPDDAAAKQTIANVQSAAKCPA